jgi:hypothetical protein
MKRTTYDEWSRLATESIRTQTTPLAGLTTTSNAGLHGLPAPLEGDETQLHAIERFIASNVAAVIRGSGNSWHQFNHF